ncbi:MAG: menaquinone biosynthesis family protein [Nitrososphaerales archaeon]
MLIRIGRSPDPDDAFMYYAMITGKVTLPGYELVHVTEDIETLNLKSKQSELEVTAISAHAFCDVASNYYLMNVGGSLGKGYGPIVVSRTQLPIDELRKHTIAIPGRHTTASLLLRMVLGQIETVEMRFDDIPRAVSQGEIDAGVIIHESQLTYNSLGLFNSLDLGAWWQKETKLPLPLGLDVVRKDLGKEFGMKFRDLLKESILYSLKRKDEALEFAMKYSRGISKSLVEKFVLMYVNDLTLDMGENGIQGLRTLYDMASRMGLIKPIEFEIV